MLVHSVTFLLVTCSTVRISLGGKCPNGQTSACGLSKACRISCNNPTPDVRSCVTLPCQDGCFCPKLKPYESVNENFVARCVSGLQKCRCTGGRVWMSCRPVPEATCNNPTPLRARGQCRGPPGCYCPSTTPIWQNGRCISTYQCVCPDKCVTAGCLQCRKCKCRNGKYKKCEELQYVCPLPSTNKGLKALQKTGCLGLTLINKQCIFFSPCPQKYEESQSNRCDLDFIQTKGCWTLVHGQCTFVAPCPEESDLSCRDLNPGTTSCKMCKRCECMNGLKLCQGLEVCLNPDKNGCIVRRTYPGMSSSSCYWASPCPKGDASKLDECSEHVINGEDFCYIPNEVTGQCEFLSPCPQISVCNEGDTYCRECQECTCYNGVVQCQDQECGDPILHGCWVEGSQIGLGGCLFVSPCPVDHNYESKRRQNCLQNPGEFFCSGCNTCSCQKNGRILCTEIACEEVTLAKGCYVPYKGNCIFVFPCP